MFNSQLIEQLKKEIPMLFHNLFPYSIRIRSLSV